MRVFVKALARMAAAAAGLMLCAAAMAQSSSTADSPHLALKGYDPVAYFTESKPVKGVNERSFDFDGARYLFSSDKNRARFVADPDRYAPQFAANCTAGLAAGKKVVADPNQWLIVDGKLYVFASEAALVRAKGDAAIVRNAHANWSRLR